MSVPAELSGIPLSKLDIRNKYNITILVIRDADGVNDRAIGPDTVLAEGDQLTVFGDRQSIIELFKGKNK